MHKFLVALVLLPLLCVASGCVWIDYLVDPVGCGTGTHEPIFPWYPHYLWNPPQSPASVTFPTTAPSTTNQQPLASTRYVKCSTSPLNRPEWRPER
jgi:hypothetical protein